MKKFCLFFIAIFCFSSWNSFAQKEGYKLTFKIKYAKQDTFFLGYPFGDKKYLMDTANVGKDGYFTFEGKDPLEGGLYFIYSKPNIYFEFIGAPSQFALETDTLDYVGNMKVKGSKENELFKGFDMFMRQKQAELKKLNEKVETTQNQGEKESLEAEITKMDQEVKAYRNDFVEKNKGTFVANLIKATIDVDAPPLSESASEEEKQKRFFYFKDHFLDNVDFSDARLLRTPILERKINEYMDKLTIQVPDSLIKSAQDIIERAKANKEVFRYCVVSMANKYETSKIMGMDAVFVGIAEKYYLSGDAFWADSALVDKIKTKVKELHPLIGEKAPEMVLTDTTTSKYYSLYKSFNSDFYVLYFYADDCGHCKKKTPVWYQLYNDELKKRGVEILAIDITKNLDNWKEFVKTNGIYNWTNLGDPNLQSNFRYEYTIERTPKVFVLDKDRKVIAKNLDSDQIVGFIDRMIEFSEEGQEQ